MKQILFYLCMCLFISNYAIADGLEPLRYNNPGLVVDLSESFRTLILQGSNVLEVK